MRKLIGLSLVAILVVTFSLSASAGVQDCIDELKGVKEYKGLYGLCVAYWSSGESEEILELYRSKADRLGVPGDLLDPPGFVSDDTCPCWDIDAVRQVLACNGYQYAGGEMEEGPSGDSFVAYLNDSFFPLLVVGESIFADFWEGPECQIVGAELDMVLISDAPVDPSEEAACRKDISGLIDELTRPVSSDCES